MPHASVEWGGLWRQALFVSYAMSFGFTFWSQHMAGSAHNERLHGSNQALLYLQAYHTYPAGVDAGLPRMQRRHI